MSFIWAHFPALPQPLSVAKEAAAEYSKVDGRVRKYGQSPTGNLKAMLQFDWELYRSIKPMAPTAAVHGRNYSQAQALILGYLQDFDESTSKLLPKTNEKDKVEAVRNLSENLLAIYRTFWRFENFIQQFLKLPAGSYGQFEGNYTKLMHAAIQ